MNSTSLFHRLNRKGILPLLVIGFVVLLAGCSLGGSGSTTTGSTPTTSPGSSAASPTTVPTANTPPATTSGACSLVTTAQASSILAGNAQAHDLGTVNDGPVTEHVCQYIVPPRGAAATFAVAVEADATTARTYFTLLQQQQQAKNPTHYQQVSGLGDAAFTNGSVLYVLKGSTIIAVGVTDVPSSSILPDEEQFAQDALPKVS